MKPGFIQDSAGYLYPDQPEISHHHHIMSTESDLLLELFEENVVAKVLRVATEALNNNVRYTATSVYHFFF
jgi:hypothetical protein